VAIPQNRHLLLVHLEACYEWYWAADLLKAQDCQVRLVRPLGLHWDGGYTASFLVELAVFVFIMVLICGEA
jgi:hypothetical protein